MATVSPEGAVLMKGDGIKSVQARMQESFEAARALGPTMKAIRQVAADFVQEIEARHLGEGLEVIEETKLRVHVPLVDQPNMKSLLETLRNTPLQRKRPTNVWHVEEIKETAEDLQKAALKSLGYEPTETGVESLKTCKSLPATKKKWWGR